MFADSQECVDRQAKIMFGDVKKQSYQTARIMLADSHKNNVDRDTKKISWQTFKQKIANIHTIMLAESCVVLNSCYQRRQMKCATK